VTESNSHSSIVLLLLNLSTKPLLHSVINAPSNLIALSIFVLRWHLSSSMRNWFLNIISCFTASVL